jgi:hypothetical protein
MEAFDAADGRDWSQDTDGGIRNWPIVWEHGVDRED